MAYSRLFSRFGLGAVVIATTIGCAQERPTINRVDSYALAKTFFVGPKINDPTDDPEFYAATTIVDVPYGVQTGVFTGAVGDLRRLKWEITKETLNARLTFEPIQNADGKGNRSTNTGQIVASFKIDSQFDIKRDYNPQTGEELNVVGENTTDRPWYERDYMRVDWSSNLVEASNSFDPLAGLRADGQSIEPLTYRVDPTDPDAPIFSPDEGYFDVTNKVYLKPKEINGVPACFYYAAIVVGGTYPYGICDSSEIKLRLSFQRIAQAGEAGYRDYEPKEWDGARFNAHGAFTHDRLGYDRHYGVVDSSWHHLLQRYNIWQKSHIDNMACTASGDADGDGTDDQCAAAPAGSRCDDLVGQCTIPFAKRTTRPNAWHYNLNGADEVIFASTNRAAEEWDAALREAVQAARRVECQRTKGKSLDGTPWAGQACDKAFPIVQTDDAEVESIRVVNRCWQDKGYKNAACAPSDPNSVAALDTMIALCHSPVKQGDDPMCGPVGLFTRPGDLRYHEVNVVPTPQAASPWGYGPTLADPLTGEVIQGGINVWNSVTDQAAQSLVDQIRWMNGELADNDITSGSYVSDWARLASAKAPGSVPLMTPGAIDQRLIGSGAITADKIAAAPQLRQKYDMRKLNQQLTARAMDITHAGATQATGGIASPDRVITDARIASVKGTPVEAQLVGPQWLEMAGIAKDQPITDDVLNQASPLRGLDPKTVSRVEQQVQNELAHKGQCMLAAPEPTGIVPLAKIIKDKFPYDAGASAQVKASRLDNMWNYLRGKLNYAVIAHEMGHTIGMRHNFASSWDKFNYRPQYWQLRTRGGTVTDACTGPVADGSTCIGPRYYDPLDQDELDQMIWMWQQTTVMDYAGDSTQDTLGLGVYDYSAARAFYADVVDVRNDGVTVPAGAAATDQEAIGTEMLDMIDTSIQPLSQAFVNNGVHYSQFNNIFHMMDPKRCRPADTTAPSWWKEDVDGKYSPVFDGHIVRSEVCDRIPVDYVDWRDMIPDQTGVALNNYNPLFVLARRAVDNQARPRMPYAFCSDEWVESGIPSCYQHDNGADIFEEMTFHDRLYEDRHIFDNFRRGRANFSIYGAYQRTVSRYHNKIESLAGEYGFYHDFVFHDIATSNKVPYSEVVSVYEGKDGALRDFMLASSLAFDHFTRAMTRPQPGPHGIDFTDPSMLRPLDGTFPGATGDVIDMPQGSSGMGDDISYGAREIENGFVSSNGYYLINSAGSYYDKTASILAILAQGQSHGNWTRLQSVDGRWLTSNLTNLYPEGARRLLGVTLIEDQPLYAPRIAAKSSGLPLTAASGIYHFPGKPVGWVSFTPDSPAICWPVNGQETCADAAGQPLPGMPATAPTSSVSIDPELGFEVQKFILFYSYVFLPQTERNDWLDMLEIFKLGGDVNPSFDASEMVQWKDPMSGYQYFAKRMGDEQIFGKTYDKGIGAKMLQWANILTSMSYEPADPLVPFDPATGRYVYKVDANGHPVVKPDANGKITPDDPANVRCDENSRCVQLRNYRGLVDFSRDIGKLMGYNIPCLNGIFGPGLYCD